MTEPEAKGVADAVASGACPVQMASFWGLAATESELFEKLGRDHCLETYSVYGFFPGIYELVYESEQPPQIEFAGRSRGRVAILRWGEAGLVVKPTQSQREEEIARIAGALGVGPRQHPSLSGFIIEELVTGVFFTRLSPSDTDPEGMYRLGGKLGGMLAGLHRHQIYYNDATLSDPSGRSHLLVSTDSSCHLIDFGVSVLLNHHPELSQEEVYNFARTLPMFRIFAAMGVTREQLHRFLEDYRRRLARVSREEIMSRDLQFMQEVLSLAARRLGEHIVEPFHQGFRESYQ